MYMMTCCPAFCQGILLSSQYTALSDQDLAVSCAYYSAAGTPRLGAYRIATVAGDAREGWQVKCSSQIGGEAKDKDASWLG